MAPQFRAIYFKQFWKRNLHDENNSIPKSEYLFRFTNCQQQYNQCFLIYITLATDPELREITFKINNYINFFTSVILNIYVKKVKK